MFKYLHSSWRFQPTSNGYHDTFDVAPCPCFVSVPWSGRNDRTTPIVCGSMFLTISSVPVVRRSCVVEFEIHVEAKSLLHAQVALSQSPNTTTTTTTNPPPPIPLPQSIPPPSSYKLSTNTTTTTNTNNNHKHLPNPGHAIVSRRGGFAPDQGLPRTVWCYAPTTHTDRFH